MLHRNRRGVGGGGGGGGLEEEAFLELSHDSCQELPKRKTIDKLDSLAASKSLPAYSLPVYSTGIAAMDIHPSVNILLGYKYKIFGEWTINQPIA